MAEIHSTNLLLRCLLNPKLFNFFDFGSCTKGIKVPKSVLLFVIPTPPSPATPTFLPISPSSQLEVYLLPFNTLP